jgi:aldose sugar dehydrogenase
MFRIFPAAISLFALTTASCSAAPVGDKAGNVAVAASSEPFRMEEKASFDEPWAITFDQGTGTLFVTEKKGAIRFLAPDGTIGTVTGVPTVDYGGQGGLGDIVFAPGQASPILDRRIVYLSWAEGGDGDTRGAAVGKAELVCEQPATCDLRDLTVIWRQTPKVTGRGHYAHRIAFSPDGSHLFIASGDRQKLTPAQDNANTLGTIVRLLPDGTPAPGNPLGSQGTPSNQIWSWGHRNILGMRFAADGRLWAVEHGPAGGDELNLIEKGANYGWPLVSPGDHYGGAPIPRHESRPDLAAPALSWNPVIAPGDMIFYDGDLFPDWKGSLLIAAMRPAGLVRVEINGKQAREVARHATRNRIRSIAQAPDGAIWIAEDGRGVTRSRLFRLSPASGE